MKTGTLQLPTRYAPAERTDARTLVRQIETLAQDRFLQTIADAVPVIVVVLNMERQVIYANRRLLEFLNTSDAGEARGRRPGEVFRCIHAKASAGGCGTTEFCRKCGAVNAVLASQNGTQGIGECRILTEDQRALDFKVWATPFLQNGERLTIFAALDISHEKRRHALERIFFHDVLNTAGVLSGLSEVLIEEEDPEEIADISNMLFRASQRLIEEIQAQRLLSSAERGDLELSLSEIDTTGLLREVADTYRGHEAADERIIGISESAAACRVTTDETLLGRVLGNMVKNALEATPAGGGILLSCTEQPDSATFSVKNPAVMDPDVQLQVFHRSFSTKGAGRGLGTFSIKLLGEKYLGGTVWFESSKPEGTIFFLRLPKGT